MSIKVDKTVFEAPHSVNASFLLLSVGGSLFNRDFEVLTLSSVRWIETGST